MKKTVTHTPGLRLRVARTAPEMSKAAAETIVSQLRRKPDLLLCASAGGTPTGTYEHLAAICKKNSGLFSRMRVLQIDEWCGLDAGSPGTCEADLNQKLLRPLGVPQRNFCGFRSNAPDPAAECKRVANWLHAHGPVDICILGLGINGHIAMNEPGDALEPSVHQSKLTGASQRHSMLAHLKKKPRFGFTLGMRDILGSREVLLLVSGSHKNKVLRRLMKPRVTTALPASLLWLHGNTIVLCDRQAAHGISHQSSRKGAA